MKRQLDANQRFQLDAVAAVTDLFGGQPQGTTEFSAINVGDHGGLLPGQDGTGLGAGIRRAGQLPTGLIQSASCTSAFARNGSA